MTEATRTNRSLIKDRVVVRDDCKLAGVTMLGVLVAIVLAGGALVYALSGPHDTTASFNAPTPERSDGTVGQDSARRRRTRSRSPTIQNARRLACRL